jgi:ribonuclease Z
MSREVIVLGTASQAPTRERSHNACLLRFDDHGVLFDPGEGAQRQMLLAGVSASDIQRICVTHFHGDHCLGLPGIIQRISLDGVTSEIPVHYPAGGEEYYQRLRHASAFYDRAQMLAVPVEKAGLIATGSFGSLYAQRLRHSVETFGYRLVEPDGRRMVRERLAEAGISGPDIGALQSIGYIDRPAGRVTLEQMSEHRRGQIVAYVMDTGVCPEAVELAADADLLVIEATFRSTEEEVARYAGHLTAADAGRIAAEAGVRRLLLTHFSQRYADIRPFADEAAKHFSGDIVLGTDLLRVPVPPRRL